MPNEHPKKGLTVISDAGRIGRVTTGRTASAPTDTNPDTYAQHRSRSTARTPDQSRLRKRRQAIVALMWSGPALFTFFITINVTQALQHGYGLHSGRPRPESVDTSHGGNGFWRDALVIGVVIPLTLSALIAEAYWLATRLGDPPDTSLTQAQIDAQRWYLIEIPSYTRGLVVLAIVCTVAISIFGAALMPTVLVVFGW
jgi:hypothetical protein